MSPVEHRLGVGDGVGSVSGCLLQFFHYLCLKIFIIKCWGRKESCRKT